MMGTNYYAHKFVFGYELVYHIGKSSAGWPFIFAEYPSKWDTEPVINTYPSWLKFLDDGMVLIYDEYGRELTLDEFKTVVENRPKNLPEGGLRYDDFRWYKNVDGYWFFRSDSPDDWS